MKNLMIEFFASNIFYITPCVFSLLIVRYTLEKYCFHRIANYCWSTQNENKKLSGNFLTKTSLPQLQSSKMHSIDRSCWHFLYYLIAVIHIAIVLHNQPWMKDDAHFWAFYEHGMTTDVWFILLLNLSFFFSLIIRILTTKRRKDFTESMVHHSLTILLIMQALNTNLYRLACLSLLILFPSDIFLELAKILNYLNYEISCAVCSTLFLIVWVITRLILCPMWISYPLIRYTYEIVGPILYCINAIAAIILLILYVFWSYKIYLIYRKLFIDKVIDEYRSDDEECTDDVYSKKQ